MDSKQAHTRSKIHKTPIVISWGLKLNHMGITSIQFGHPAICDYCIKKDY